MAHGKLVLVPAPLDFGTGHEVPLREIIPDAVLARAAGITHWICENAKTGRAHLKRIGEVHPLALPLREQAIAELPREVHKKGDRVAGFDAKPMLAAALGGHDIGLMSEAGMPAIADPGASVVKAAHELGIEVVACVGPVSIVLALAASGLHGQDFAFVGYVPQDTAARAARLRELEMLAARGQTQLFIETPYRNAAVWDALMQNLKPSTRVCVAMALSLPSQLVVTRDVKSWRRQPSPVDNALPAVFAIGN